MGLRSVRLAGWAGPREIVREDAYRLRATHTGFKCEGLDPRRRELRFAQGHRDILPGDLYVKARWIGYDKTSFFSRHCESCAVTIGFLVGEGEA
jgi:hypothetical protein